MLNFKPPMGRNLNCFLPRLWKSNRCDSLDGSLQAMPDWWFQPTPKAYYTDPFQHTLAILGQSSQLSMLNCLIVIIFGYIWDVQQAIWPGNRKSPNYLADHLMYVIVGIAILPGTKKIVENHLKSLQALQALCAVPQHDLPIFRCHGTNGQLPVLDIGGVRLTLPSKFVSVKTTSEKDSTIFNMKPFHHHWLSYVNLTLDPRWVWHL